MAYAPIVLEYNALSPFYEYCSDTHLDQDTYAIVILTSTHLVVL